MTPPRRHIHPKPLMAIKPLTSPAHSRAPWHGQALVDRPSTTHSQKGHTRPDPPKGLSPPKLTPGLGVMGSSVIFGQELGLGPQCPRERQQPRGGADAGEAGGLHPRGMGGQRDGGSVV